MLTNIVCVMLDARIAACGRFDALKGGMSQAGVSHIGGLGMSLATLSA